MPTRQPTAWFRLPQLPRRCTGAAELREAKYVDVLTSATNRIALVQARRPSRADGAVALSDGHVLTPRGVVIATGARPQILPLEGIERVAVYDSTSAMALPAQPRSLLVIGGHAVALELGQTFARLGTQVTLLQRSERLIPEHAGDRRCAGREFAPGRDYCTDRRHAGGNS